MEFLTDLTIQGTVNQQKAQKNGILINPIFIKQKKMDVIIYKELPEELCYF